MRKLGGGTRELGMVGGWWLEEGVKGEGEGERGGGERRGREVGREEERRYWKILRGKGRRREKRSNRKGGGTVSRKDNFTRRTIMHTSVVSLCTVMVLPLAVTLVT